MISSAFGRQKHSGYQMDRVGSGSMLYHCSPCIYIKTNYTSVLKENIEIYWVINFAHQSASAIISISLTLLVLTHPFKHIFYYTPV